MEGGPPCPALVDLHELEGAGGGYNGTTAVCVSIPNGMGPASRIRSMRGLPMRWSGHADRLPTQIGGRHGLFRRWLLGSDPHGVASARSSLHDISP